MKYFLFATRRTDPLSHALRGPGCKSVVIEDNQRFSFPSLAKRSECRIFHVQDENEIDIVDSKSLDVISFEKSIDSVRDLNESNFKKYVDLFKHMPPGVRIGDNEIDSILVVSSSCKDTQAPADCVYREDTNNVNELRDKALGLVDDLGENLRLGIGTILIQCDEGVFMVNERERKWSRMDENDEEEIEYIVPRGKMYKLNGEELDHISNFNTTKSIHYENFPELVDRFEER